MTLFWISQQDNPLVSFGIWADEIIAGYACILFKRNKETVASIFQGDGWKVQSLKSAEGN